MRGGCFFDAAARGIDEFPVQDAGGEGEFGAAFIPEDSRDGLLCGDGIMHNAKRACNFLSVSNVGS